MERLEFIERCEEVLKLPPDLAQVENDRMIDQGLEPISTIVGRKEDVARIFWKETIHKLQDGDSIAPRVIGDVDSCIRGIAIWREKTES